MYKPLLYMIFCLPLLTSAIRHNPNKYIRFIKLRQLKIQKVYTSLDMLMGVLDKDLSLSHLRRAQTTMNKITIKWHSIVDHVKHIQHYFNDYWSTFEIPDNEQFIKMSDNYAHVAQLRSHLSQAFDDLQDLIFNAELRKAQDKAMEIKSLLKEAKMQESLI